MNAADGTLTAISLRWFRQPLWQLVSTYHTRPYARKVGSAQIFSRSHRLWPSSCARPMPRITRPQNRRCLVRPRRAKPHHGPCSMAALAAPASIFAAGEMAKSGRKTQARCLGRMLGRSSKPRFTPPRMDRGVDCPVPCFYFFPRASIAARTFGGDIGSSVSRRPVARSIALAMAAMGAQMLTSAAPFAPYG